MGFDTSKITKITIWAVLGGHVWFSNGVGGVFSTEN